MCIELHKGKLLTTKSRYIEVCSEKKNSKEGYLCILRAMVTWGFVSSAAQVCWTCVSAPRHQMSTWRKAQNIWLIWMKADLMSLHNYFSSFEKVNCKSQQCGKLSRVCCSWENELPSSNCCLFDEWQLKEKPANNLIPCLLCDVLWGLNGV